MGARAWSASARTTRLVTIELKVGASNRDCYASGALEAAKFVVKQSPGIYSMYDVLDLN